MQSTVSIIVFDKKKDAQEKRLDKVVNGLAASAEIQECKDFDSLRHALAVQPAYKTITVIFTDCDEDLDEIINLAPLLNIVRLILVVHDQQKTTIAKAHGLRPRYLSFTGSEAGDVNAVLKKMHQRLKDELNRT